MSILSDPEAQAGVPLPSGAQKAIYLDLATGYWVWMDSTGATGPLGPTGSGAMAAGTDSGSGGTGSATADGTAGTQPGGGGGSTNQTHTSGAGAAGQCRYTFYLVLANFLMFL